MKYDHSDPNGPQPVGEPSPVPEAEADLLVRQKRMGRDTLGVLAGAIGAGGALLVAIASVTTPCRGATRSSRIQWESRRAAAQEAVEAQRTAAGKPALPELPTVSTQGGE